MSAITTSNDRAATSLASRDQAAVAVAPAYRFAARVLRRAVFRHLKSRSARDLRSIPDHYRKDIGVPAHAIDDVAGELAARRLDAWMQQVITPHADRMAA